MISASILTLKRTNGRRLQFVRGGEKAGDGRVITQAFPVSPKAQEDII